MSESSDQIVVSTPASLRLLPRHRSPTALRRGVILTGLAVLLSFAGLARGEDVDSTLLSARNYVRQWLAAMPDVVCLQTTERFATNGGLLWRREVISQAELTVERGEERYQLLSVNGKPAGNAASAATQIEGSSGEFLSAVRQLFDPASRAEFRYRGSRVERGRTLERYEFRVRQENSQWYVGADPGYRPAYSGSIWMDGVDGRLARIEMEANTFPAKLGIRSATLQTTFEPVALNGAFLVLPGRSEVTVFMKWGYTERRVLRYSGYRRFTSASRLVVGSPE